MDRRRLVRLREDIGKLRRRAGIRATELQALAKRIGRVPHSRGKEPTWVKSILAKGASRFDAEPSGDLNRFTAREILNQLEADVDRFEARLEDEADGNASER